MADDYDTILKNIKNLRGEEITSTVNKMSVPIPEKKGYGKIGLYLSLILILLGVNTVLYFTYSWFIKPCAGWLPDLTWFSMLAIFLFYHIFTLGIFDIFGAMNSFSKMNKI